MTRKKGLLIVLVLALAGAAAWLLTGGYARSAEARVRDELVARGMPAPMAACMAGRMVERLSLTQLRKLERLAPEPGEPDVPLDVAGLLERTRRVDDPQVLEVTATSAAICAFSTL